MRQYASLVAKPSAYTGVPDFCFEYPWRIRSVAHECRGLCGRFTHATLNGAKPDAERTRPLVFICHSLGGVVLKQALITASAVPDNYGAIMESTFGVI